jgi:hypothetical protein
MLIFFLLNFNNLFSFFSEFELKNEFLFRNLNGKFEGNFSTKCHFLFLTTNKLKLIILK